MDAIDDSTAPMLKRHRLILTGGTATILAAAMMTSGFFAPAFAADTPALSEFEVKPAPTPAPGNDAGNASPQKPAPDKSSAGKKPDETSKPAGMTASKPPAAAPPDADAGATTPTASIGPANGKEVTLAQMMVTLNDEARRVTKDASSVSVKDKPDFAARQNIRVSESEIIRVLARRIHREPVVEAYVKWQLMSFGPDLSKATPDQTRGIIASMPPVIAQPQPSYEAKNDPGLEIHSSFSKSRAVPGTSSTSSGKTSVRSTIISEGVSFSTSGGTDPNERYLNVDSKVSNAHLAELKHQAKEINRLVFAARQRIIERIPRENGVQLGASLKDLTDRILAGDPTYDETSSAYAKACAAAAKPKSSVSRDVRELLAKETEKLAEIRTFVIDKVKPAQGGGVETPGHDVQMPEKDANAAITSLRETNDK